MASGWAIDTEADSLGRTLAELAKAQPAPVAAAIEQAATLLADAARGRAKGSIGASIRALSTGDELGADVVGVVEATHPGAASMEFGRTHYYRDYTGRAQRSGQRFKVAAGRGQKARPFIGIAKGDAAIGDVEGQVGPLILSAITEAWEHGNA